VPTFAKQIAAGGPVTVTHPEVTRYFMTIPEAVSLVLQSGAQGVGGEIFVLDMATPVKIMDVARQMIELSGLRPDVDIEIAIIGLRPGEKLFEELSHTGENITSTHHPKIMRFISDPLPLEQVEAAIQEFERCLDSATPADLKAGLKQIIPEYVPYTGKGRPDPIGAAASSSEPSRDLART
jgi:FlaA1/EpsC-like NDP-sugar epimerase